MALRERLAPEEALDRVGGALGDRARDAKLNFDAVDLVVEPSKLREVLTILRDDIACKCRFFTFLSGVDRSTFGGEDAGDEDGFRGLEVLVLLYSPDNHFHVTIHVPLEWENPVCPSIHDIFAGASWHERECHEMFGIHFEGHPNLAHLYLPEDFEGNPLRKSFRLPARSWVKDWPGAKDPDEAAAGGR